MHSKFVRFGLLILLAPLWIVLWLTVPLSFWLLFSFQTAVGLALALLGSVGMGWGGVLLLYPEEDHFLFFSKRERIIQQLATWLRQHQ